MLTSIKKIQKFGVFAAFTAANDLPEFGRYNVIYGENGSGKTTLSRLFSALEIGQHPEHPELEFTITTDAGQLTKGHACQRKMRVFNSDYVEANIGQFQAPIRHILIIGRENKALAEEIKAEQATLTQRVQLIASAQQLIEKYEQDKGKVFSATAKTIGEATSGTTLRSYRKPNAEAAYAHLVGPSVLTESELEVHRATVHQDQLDPIPTVEFPVRNLISKSGLSTIALAVDTVERANTLLQRTAQSGALKRLADEPAIAAWVGKGLELHRHYQWERCEFCDQTLPASRLEALADHFGAEDQQLKHEIESAQSDIGATIEALNTISLPPKAVFYAELRDEFDAAHSELEVARTDFKDALSVVHAALDRKLTLRTTSYSEALSIDPSRLLAADDKVAGIILRHNEKTASFEKEKENARRALEAHYLGTIRDQISEYETQISEKTAEKIKLTDGSEELEDKRSLADLARSIGEKQARVSSAHAGGAELTSHLNNFLGRTDLSFKSGADGYQVLRNGKAAKRLSEGEKTAIAFLYFVVHLGDQDFDLANGIVVVDDPVSSLDSSAIYQAFAFLKNAVKDAKQVFIFTHNFDFLRLVLNWVKNVKRSTGTKSYYMIVCSESEAGRNSAIIPLDKLLLQHPTEYHFLFKVLYTFKSDGSILSSYHIPNVARKVLETFLEFHAPSEGSLYDKLEGTEFDHHKKTAIYKFANDLSHPTGKGFDPALVAETQKNATYLLEMIKSVAPLHYAGLEKLSAL